MQLSVLFMIVFPEWLCSFLVFFFSETIIVLVKRKKKNICRYKEKLLIRWSVYLMHAVEGNQNNVILKIDPECMVTFYKGILNKTYLYILINSLVWHQLCSIRDNCSFHFCWTPSLSRSWRQTVTYKFNQTPVMNHFKPQLWSKHAVSFFPPPFPSHPSICADLCHCERGSECVFVFSVCIQIF